MTKQTPRQNYQNEQSKSQKRPIHNTYIRNSVFAPTEARIPVEDKEAAYHNPQLVFAQLPRSDRR